MSLRASIVFSPIACSGDMYCGVPSESPVCVIRCPAGVLHGEGDAEVGDQRVPALQQDVLRLDVAMDDPCACARTRVRRPPRAQCAGRRRPGAAARAPAARAASHRRRTASRSRAGRRRRPSRAGAGCAGAAAAPSSGSRRGTARRPVRAPRSEWRTLMATSRSCLRSRARIHGGHAAPVRSSRLDAVAVGCSAATGRRGSLLTAPRWSLGRSSASRLRRVAATLDRHFPLAQEPLHRLSMPGFFRDYSLASAPACRGSGCCRLPARGHRIGGIGRATRVVVESPRVRGLVVPDFHAEGVGALAL